MNHDAFEQRIQRQPFRPLPSEWRAEILLAARQASTAQNESVAMTQQQPESRLALHVPAWRALFSTLLWPSPKAWYGLAAIWLVLLVINAETADNAKRVARTLPRPAPEMIAAWREQVRLLSELVQPQEIPVAEPPKPTPPRPRSEGRNSFLIT